MGISHLAISKLRAVRLFYHLRHVDAMLSSASQSSRSVTFHHWNAVLTTLQYSSRVIGQCRGIPSPRIMSTPILDILIGQCSVPYMISIAKATAQRRIDRVIPSLRYRLMISRVPVLFSSPALIWSCGLSIRI